ncbi:hypothetical protein H1230_07505 [Paenibacillus sp. 19GGS1-52]|uniref:hypothetical protein n=1 Tax=Paenibacillus sp. 19GGS1-52 TaxID=2758563 RepID=UPI001EFBFA9B|nr:hypothetical protein [Paenibacillus sp. 19GGS1-52]ULO08634.1 hypothetical protein H1230_07505 [Paenibacillus sp. 19GGS1-52]
MFNKRWKKILLWTLSIIVVLGVAGLFAANYAVDKLMNSMAGGFDLESENNVKGIPEDGITPPATVANDNSTTMESTANPMADPTALPTEGSPVTGNTTGENVASATSKPTNTPTTDKGTTKDGYAAQVSTDKAQEIKKNVTVKEKADVATIVMGQLSVSDIKRLQELASGGLSIDEKREARSIILGKVTEAQYNELSQIAKKYGVSQGKTRDQILVEEQSQAKEEGSE